MYFGQPRGFNTNEKGERTGYNTMVYSESEVRMAWVPVRKYCPCFACACVHVWVWLLVWMCGYGWECVVMRAHTCLCLHVYTCLTQAGPIAIRKAIRTEDANAVMAARATHPPPTNLCIQDVPSGRASHLFVVHNPCTWSLVYSVKCSHCRRTRWPCLPSYSCRLSGLRAWPLRLLASATSACAAWRRATCLRCRNCGRRL